ncbi:LOW QUALITY PROTEIN: ATP-dependent DNA helicase [Frankliniella fusca]|uniref:ATP-dependent DNA helicase n=1 Tax=Frankliniella fusca TaxID=407009 RepID=A0AAE1I2L3_9NEOP|nr:LOW QUALITY PROTEIN: ATP-dependent DNA helicase [Frankliniella fusca]
MESDEFGYPDDFVRNSISRKIKLRNGLEFVLSDEQYHNIFNQVNDVKENKNRCCQSVDVPSTSLGITEESLTPFRETLMSYEVDITDGFKMVLSDEEFTELFLCHDDVSFEEQDEAEKDVIYSFLNYVIRVVIDDEPNKEKTKPDEDPKKSESKKNDKKKDDEEKKEKLKRKRKSEKGSDTDTSTRKKSKSKRKSKPTDDKKTDKTETSSDEDSSDDEEINRLNKAASKIPTYKSIKNLVRKSFYKVLDISDVETTKGRTIRLKLEDGDADDVKQKRKKDRERQRKYRKNLDKEKQKKINEKARVSMRKLRERKSDREKEIERKRNSERRYLTRQLKKSGLQYNFNEGLDVDQHNFNIYMKSLSWQECPHCHRRVVQSCFNTFRCHKNCHLFTEENDMDPGEVPKELQDLTYIEKQLIARVHSVISLYKFKKCQYNYRGQVINFSQDVQSVADKLPHLVSDLNNVVVVKLTEAVTVHDFFVRKGKVLDALVWLKDHNPSYSDIIIDYENLDTLPTDGCVYSDLKHSVNFHNDDDVGDDFENEDDSDLVFTHVPDVLNSSLKKSFNNLLIWPSLGTTPINEFSSPSYISMCFPHLFPYGKADYTVARPHKVRLSDYVQHLLLYKDGRFSKDERFRYFIMNSEMRWNSLNIGNVYVKKNSIFSKMTIVQLKDYFKKNPWIADQIMHFGSRIRTTKSYWNSRCSELLDMVNQLGTPTVFFTLSSADYHWPDLYRLLGYDVNKLSVSEKSNLLNDVVELDSDFCHLLNQVQRHTKCSKSHCLRPIGKSNTLECRYRFPRDMVSETEFEINDKGDIADIKFKRNDPLVNKYNRWVLQTWRSNIDISPILSKQIVYRYIAKYASKSEVKSISYNELLTEILNTSSDDADMSKKAIRKLLISSCGERDYCAQEVMHFLMHYNREFVVINLKNFDWAIINNGLSSTNILDLYAKRPSHLEKLSLYEIGRFIRFVSGKPVWRSKEAVVRFFPKCVREHNVDLLYLYKSQIFYPWRPIDDLIPLNDDMIQNIDNSYKKYVIPHSESDFHDGNQDDKDDYSIIMKEAPEKDNEGILSSYNPNKQGNRGNDKSFHDNDYEWVYMCHKVSTEAVQNLYEKLRTDYESKEEIFINSHSLSYDQKSVFNFVKELSEKLKSNAVVEGQFAIVQGMPGTGKTYLLKCCVNYIKKNFDSRAVKVIAPTGVSAKLINGTTLHSFLCHFYKVMLRKNINVSRGLVNGALGVIKHIVFEKGKKPPLLPLCILVKFETVTLSDLNIQYVPIIPVVSTWYRTGVLCSRSQLPVSLCWACTIHKAQGLTLSSMVLDVGASEFALGLFYVALSRVPDKNSLCLVMSLSLDRLNSAGIFINKETCCCAEKHEMQSKQKNERKSLYNHKLYMRKYRQRLSEKRIQQVREKDRLYRQKKRKLMNRKSH